MASGEQRATLETWIAVAGESGASGQNRSRHLHHLTGARCLASIWIVCGHFAPPCDTGVFSAARHRGNVAVCFFIVMSGFVTQWVYGARLRASDQHRICSFYITRIVRVVITTWVAMLLGLAVVIVQLRGGFPDIGHILRCFAFLETWYQPLNWCPNGQTWTVAALLPSWLLYPLTCKGIARVEELGGAYGLLGLAVVLWSMSYGPLLIVFLRQSNWITARQNGWDYEWPPSQLPDFALGAVVAALALRRGIERRHDKEPSPTKPHILTCGLLADASVAAMAILCLAAPASGKRVGWEPLFNHGCAPLLAVFLYGSASDECGGIVARVLTHDALVALGEYSFEVYLFQYPIHEILVAIGDISGSYTMQNNEKVHNTNSCGFMAFFIVLWIVSGLYAEHVNSRLSKWLRKKAAKSDDISSSIAIGSP